MFWKKRPTKPYPTGPQQEAKGIEEPTHASESLSTFEQNPIQIVTQHKVCAVAFLADGEHMVGGSEAKRIHCWRLRDGKEVGTPMDAGDTVGTIAVSQDGKRIVSGTEGGEMAVWNAESREKVNGFKLEACHGRLAALDISPDTKRIAGVSGTVTRLWALNTGKRLLDLTHDKPVCAVKFSPDSCLLATGSESSLYIYDSKSGWRILADIPGIRVISIAWASDSKQLYALSWDGHIHYLDVSSGTRLSWRIHSTNEPRCISLANNGSFIVASADSSVSLWDTSTRQQIGDVIRHPARVEFMTISANHVLVISASSGVTMRDFNDLPSPYVDDNQKKLEARFARAEAYLKSTIHSLRTRDPNERPRRENFSNLNDAVQNLQDATKQKVENLNETIKLLRADLVTHSTSIDVIAEREETIKRLNAELADSQDTAKRREEALEKTNDKIADLERTIHDLRDHLAQTQRFADETLEKLGVELANSKQTVDSLTKVLRAYHWKHQCETLYADGYVIRAAEFLLEITRSTSGDVKADSIIADWISGFTDKCIITLERTGDELSGTEKHDEGLAAYTTALTLNPPSPNALLEKWANTALLHGSTRQVLEGAKEFKLPRFAVYRVICDNLLEKHNRIMEAIECFRQMQTELILDTSIENERADWERKFPHRCSEKLANLAVVAMDAGDYNAADKHFSTILSLGPHNRVDILIKRAEARILMKSWEDALNDANEAIELDPTSYHAHKQKHAALHGAKRYKEAVAAFDAMRSELDKLPNERVSGLHPPYTDPRPRVRETINATLSQMPQVLIDTTTGQLLDKIGQTKAFEADSVFDELVSSMTTGVDDQRVLKEVKKFYRYVMLSHKWLEHNEPRYQEVKNVAVYRLKDTPGSVKLKTFCSIVGSEFGIRWAWSDTCCIDQENNVVLQESLIAMFTWYRGSCLTLVYLLDVSSQDVLSQSKDVSLQNSIWNKRAWTYQEYVAAEIIKFYTKDWKPYPGLKLENHKDEPSIISQMERVSRLSVERMAVSRPSLERVREKLYMASKREAKKPEDIAYSLFGIFNVNIGIMYGEGTRAVGRFLELVLARSHDTTILAWTGPQNGYNSCLPLNLTVYDPLVPPHIPLMETDALNQTVADLQSSISDLSLTTRLYDALSKLELVVTPGSSRLQLPCIRFPISRVILLSAEADAKLYRATTSTFGDIEIKTARTLNVENEHYLIHPWMQALLDQEHSRGENRLDVTMRALRLVARLRQRFGALLFEKVSRKEYKRVAADCLIMVGVPGGTPLTDLMDNFERIDVL